MSLGFFSDKATCQTLEFDNVKLSVSVMCVSESGFGFESGFKAFLAGFGFGFRPQKGKPGFGLKKRWVDHFTAVGFESESLTGFGFKKIEMDSDSSGFGFEVSGFGSGFEMSGFAHHWSVCVPA